MVESIEILLEDCVRVEGEDDIENFRDRLSKFILAYEGNRTTLICYMKMIEGKLKLKLSEIK